MIISRCMLMLFYLDWSAFFQANCVFSGASTAANWRLFIRRGTYYCSDCSAYRDSTDLYLLSPAIDCPIDRSTCPFSYGTLSSQKEHALAGRFTRFQYLCSAHIAIRPLVSFESYRLGYVFRVRWVRAGFASFSTYLPKNGHPFRSIALICRENI
jgi:hypothetical protein